VGVIAIFIRQILTGEIPVIYGDGEQTRDYVFVRDVVGANLLALKGISGTYNIGTGREVSVNEILRVFERILGRSIKAEYRAARKGEAKRIVLAVSKAKQELGWRPKVSFEDGLAETIEWYKRQN
jgi:UDP-glucose 4-epimerase